MTKKSRGHIDGGTRCRAGGFTLIELVIAMGLFAIGMLGTVLMSSGLVRENLTARQQAVATRLAQSKIEVLLISAYPDIAGSVEENIDARGASGCGKFRREVAVEENSDPRWKKIAVTVSWPSGGMHRVVLTSVVAAP